jgi:hypothetical protein
MGDEVNHKAFIITLLQAYNTFITPLLHPYYVLIIYTIVTPL